MKLPMLDPLAEIRKLYFETNRATIDRDFARALDLLKTMNGEDQRARATVFMHGLAEMRKQWQREEGQREKEKGQGKGRTKRVTE